VHSAEQHTEMPVLLLIVCRAYCHGVYIIDRVPQQLKLGLIISNVLPELLYSVQVLWHPRHRDLCQWSICLNDTQATSL